MKTTRKISAGLGDINYAILRAESNYIWKPFSNLINESYLRGEYRGDLKLLKSIPNFKNKGSRDEINNYRNICIQNQIAKVLDHFLSDSIISWS